MPINPVTRDGTTSLCRAMIQPIHMAAVAFLVIVKINFDCSVLPSIDMPKQRVRTSRRCTLLAWHACAAVRFLAILKGRLLTLRRLRRYRKHSHDRRRGRTACTCVKGSAYKIRIHSETCLLPGKTCTTNMAIFSSDHLSTTRFRRSAL